MTRPGITAAACGLLFLPLSAQADNSPAPVGEVVVTATRLPTPLPDAPSAHVITAADIEARQATFAFDVLDTVPGVAISHTGPFGGLTSVKIRGASSDKTLVLVDGEVMNDPSQPAGGFDFASLDLAEVDRIEILSGPQASLWGSDAIGGVISITTREPQGWRGLVEGGSFGTVRAAASTGAASDRGALGLGVGWFSSDGISKADARDGNTETDGFDSLSVHANARVALGDRISVDGRLAYNRARADFDSFGGPTGVIDGPDSQTMETVSGFGRIGIKDLFGFDHEVRVEAMTLDRVDNVFFGTLFPFEAKGGRTDVRWTAQRSFGSAGALMLGLEDQHARENAGDGAQHTSNAAAFAVWRWTPTERLAATFSVRRDDPSRLKAVTTARASGVFRLGGGFSLTGSAGQGFKAPSLYQTTYPCFECATPGPAVGLRPEHAVGLDGGIAWRRGGASASVTLYRLSVSDQLDYVYPDGYVNLEHTRATGVEAEAETPLAAGFGVRAAYTYADARDLGSGLPLLRVPRNAGSASITWRRGPLDADLTMRAQSKAADAFGTIRPFAVANIAAGYAVNPHVRLTARIENLADARYQEAFGYGEPGRAIYLGVRLTD